MNTNKNEKRPRKGLMERREKILIAASELFAEKGIDHTTIDDIAERAGVGKGTIYRRAGNKESLIDILIETSAELAIQNIRAKIKKRENPILQFKEAVNAFCDFYENNLNLVMMFIPQFGPGSKITVPEKSCEAKKAVLKVFKLMENILENASKKNLIRHIDAPVITKGFFNFLSPHFYQYLRIKYNYTKSEIAQLTIDLFLNGLRNKK